MAQKRAKIQAVIGVTRTSGLFTQDLDEHEFPPEPKVVVETPASTEPHGPAMATANGIINPTETHAEKIARVKAEAAAKKGQAEPTVEAAPEPTKTNGPAPEGSVYVSGINVKYGSMVMKDGKQQPAWGPLFVFAFSAKVKATDGSKVTDATTFDSDLAAQGETARDAKTPVRPVLEPGKKKGSFNLVRFD